jgi:hypothetical protein
VPLKTSLGEVFRLEKWSIFEAFGLNVAIEGNRVKTNPDVINAIRDQNPSREKQKIVT